MCRCRILPCLGVGVTSTWAVLPDLIVCGVQSLMREQMRNMDRAMSNIESHPEGFNALRRMYENVQVRTLGRLQEWQSEHHRQIAGKTASLLQQLVEVVVSCLLPARSMNEVSGLRGFPEHLNALAGTADGCNNWQRHGGQCCRGQPLCFPVPAKRSCRGSSACHWRC